MSYVTGDLIAARVICDSVSPQGHRLTTIEYALPTYLLAQLNTHRVFSRNARSARAVPVGVLLDEVKRKPVIPYFGVNQKGMIAGALPVSIGETELEKVWLEARDAAIEKGVNVLTSYNVHKQSVNRLLAPFTWTYGVISSTDWVNFLYLRMSVEAEPLMQVFAQKVQKALNQSTPIKLPVGAWHLPYVLPSDARKLPIETAIKLSVARCARVSVKPFSSEENNDLDADLRLYDTLLENHHMSPFEHVACVPSLSERIDIAFSGFWDLLHNQTINTKYGNFSGWLQYRKLLGY